MAELAGAGRRLVTFPLPLYKRKLLETLSGIVLTARGLRP